MNLLANYFFYPIYLVYNIFMELNKEYMDYVKSTYSSTNDDDDVLSYTTSIELDFIMIKNFETLYEIKLNSKVFVSSYYDNSNNSEYIIGLRKISLFPKITLLMEYLKGNHNLVVDNKKLFNKTIFNNIIDKYTIYEYDRNKKSIQVHIIQSDKYKITFNNISTSYILISNILNYIASDKYQEIIEDNYNYNDRELFDKWIEPINPDDTTNYKKLLERKINRETVKIDGLLYTDILCYRNFIQSDYQSAIRILYPNTNDINETIYMPILFTTYRINQQNQILTILH